MEWTRLVNRKDPNNDKKVWQPNKNSRVCSSHFVDMKPTEANPYPTLNLGPQNVNVRIPKSRKRPAERNPCPNINKARKSMPADGHVSAEPENETDQITNCDPRPKDLLDAPNELGVEGNSGEKEDFPLHCKGCGSKTKQLLHLGNCLKRRNKAIGELKKKVLAQGKSSFGHQKLVTDKKVKFYTGIPTRKAFDTLYQLLLPKVRELKHWHGPSKVSSPLKHFSTPPKKAGRHRKLDGKDEFLLTLIKLRLGILNEDLGDRFNISATTVSKTLTTWFSFLSANLVPALLFNPPKEAVQLILPKSFKSIVYRNVRYIIDCTEIFIEKPKDLQLQALTWSDYKQHQTVKILVSILPTGFFNFVSKCWGGRTSDNHLTKNCGFLDIVEPYDSVMADRGFQIREDLLLRRADLHIPPGRCGTDQMSKRDVKKTQEIANHRIYVEMAIRRLKSFRILKHELPLTLLSQIDDIVCICAALCNLYPQLVRKE